MNRSTAAASVGTIDRLLDELANLATSPDVSTSQLCNRTVQVAESLLDLKWAAVVASASGGQSRSDSDSGMETSSQNDLDAPVFVAGSDMASGQLANLYPQYPKLAGQPNRTGWLNALDRLPHICVTPIQIRKQTWGWLIAAKNPQRRSRVLKLKCWPGLAKSSLII